MLKYTLRNSIVPESVKLDKFIAVTNTYFLQVYVLFFCIVCKNGNEVACVYSIRLCTYKRSLVRAKKVYLTTYQYNPCLIQYIYTTIYRRALFKYTGIIKDEFYEVAVFFWTFYYFFIQPNNYISHKDQ